MKGKGEKQEVKKSKAAANSFTSQENSSNNTAQFVNNRPEAVTQRKIQEMANGSTQVKQLQAVQFMADKNSKLNAPVQFSGNQPIQKKGDKKYLIELQDELEEFMDRFEDLEGEEIYANLDRLYWSLDDTIHHSSRELSENELREIGIQVSQLEVDLLKRSRELEEEKLMEENGKQKAPEEKKKPAVSSWASMAQKSASKPTSSGKTNKSKSSKPKQPVNKKSNKKWSLKDALEAYNKSNASSLKIVGGIRSTLAGVNWVMVRWDGCGQFSLHVHFKIKKGGGFTIDQKWNKIKKNGDANETFVDSLGGERNKKIKQLIRSQL